MSSDQHRRPTADRPPLAGVPPCAPLPPVAGLAGLDRRSVESAPSGSVGDHAPAGWRLAAAMVVGLCSLLAFVGLSRLRIDDDLRTLLRDADADFQLIDEVADRFGTPDRDCIICATARSGDLFEPSTLFALRFLAGRLAEIDGVVQVRSMFDIRRQGIAGAVLPVIPRVGKELSAADGAAAKARAIDHPLIADHLLSADASSGLLIARLEAAADRPPRLGSVVASIERLLATTESEDGALQLSLTGLPALRKQTAEALGRDMLIFNSLGLCLAVVVLAFAARSVRATIVACVPPLVGAVWAMGVVGLLGVPVNLLTSVVPSLAIVVGTCDSIHFIEDMRRSARRGLMGVAASRGAIRRVGAACGLTSLVTAIGFASLAAARIDAVRMFGLAAAGGAVASFLAVTLLSPLLASARPFSGLRLGRSSRHAGRLAAALTAFSVRNARTIAVAGCAATLLLAIAAARLDADSRMVDSLPRAATASRTLMRVDEEFGGVMGVDVVMRWPDGIGWLDRPVIESLEQVHAVLERSGGITRAISLATVARTLPTRARQRLDPTDFRNLIDADTRTAIVRARVRDLGSRKLEAIYDQIDDGLAELAADRPGWMFELTGMSAISARNIHQLVRDLASSLLLEVLVIGGILAVAFRSPLAGIVSLVPNVFPLAVIGALLIALGRSLNPATAIVFNVCLGLAVDDTVHVLSALQRQSRQGHSITIAIRRAVAEMGNGVVLGGLVLAVGFASITVSSMPALAGFGTLAFAAVAAATVAELMFLPALLVVTDAVVRRWPLTRHDGIFGTGRLAAEGDSGIKPLIDT